MYNALKRAEHKLSKNNKHLYTNMKQQKLHALEIDVLYWCWPVLMIWRQLGLKNVVFLTSLYRARGKNPIIICNALES